MHNILVAAAYVTPARADGGTLARKADFILAIARTAFPTIAANSGWREYRLGVNHV